MIGYGAARRSHGVMSLVLYHNPRCSKSRELHGALEERGVAFEVVEYLADPLSREALEAVVSLFPDAPGDLVRKDKRFAELGLDETDYVDAASVVEVLLAHPELMQRPILRAGARAAIGRPAEQALALL